jgi:hypothetical protein
MPNVMLSALIPAFLYFVWHWQLAPRVAWWPSGPPVGALAAALWPVSWAAGWLASLALNAVANGVRQAFGRSAVDWFADDGIPGAYNPWTHGLFASLGTVLWALGGHCLGVWRGWWPG